MKTNTTIKVVTVLFGLILTSSASAAQLLVKVIQESTPISSNVVKQVPVKSCRIDQVPIYSTEIVEDEPSVVDKATGAIVGGVIGSHIGDGDGKNIATFLGAVMGAEMVDRHASKGIPQQVINGYREQEVCEMITQHKSVNEITGYQTYIEFGGQIWQLDTPISYSRGDFVKVNIDMTMAY